MTFTFYTELPAADMNRARRWYSEKLGLEPYKHGGEPVEDPARLTEVEYDLYYDTGSSRFGLYESWTAGRNEATAARLVVDDFDSVFADLLERAWPLRTTTTETTSERWTEYWSRPTVRRPPGSKTRKETSWPSAPADDPGY